MSAALRDLRRQLANHNYEEGENQFRTSSGLFIGATYVMRVNDEPAIVANNILPTQGIHFVLDLLLHSQAKVSWFIAPFASPSATPSLGWTGNNFATESTEFTAYDEAGRVPVVCEVAAGGLINNFADSPKITVSTAPAQTTIAGMGVLSQAGKGTQGGFLLSAVKFPTARTGLIAGDRIALEFQLALLNQ